MKFLCVGDVHLGRQPARLSSAVLERVSARELSPGAAWRLTVKEALHRRVDAVLLAGDVVEQNDDFYEAYSDLSHGVRQLTQAGIRVLGVAGNHDVEVLPRLADALPDFQLLGRDGAWSSEIIHGAEGQEVRVVGWSFCSQITSGNPLHLAFPERLPITTVGLLHCDRDQTGSPYAPVRSSELQTAPVDAWLLGHIHKPDALSGPRPMGYLGSVSGLGPGERGAHGPWQLAIAGDGKLEIEQLPLAPLRWEEITIALDGMTNAADIHAAVVRALENRHQSLCLSAHRPRAVGCRLLLTGRTGLRAGIERALQAANPLDNPLERDGILYFVHEWRMHALPAVNLPELARSSDPVGLLARKLLVLRGDPSEERMQLIQAVRRRLEATVQGKHFAALRAEAPDDSRTAALLEASALRALDQLLAQREAEA